MSLLISTFVTSVAQLIFLFLLAVFIWLFTGRKHRAELLKWIGIKPIHWRKEQALAFLIILVLYIVIKGFGQFLVPSGTEAKLVFYHAGAVAILPALISAFIQSGCFEEVLFRSLIGKNMMHRFGYRIGNNIQSLLFGLYYFTFSLSTLGLAFALAMGVLSAGCGYLLGYLNEQKNEGSILPSIIVNSIASFIASLFILF